MRISRSFRVAALLVAVSGACATAGILEPIAGCLSLLLVVLFTRFLGRGFGRLGAGFASFGIAGVTLGAHHPALGSSSIIRSGIAILAVWICAELVSQRSRRPSSTSTLKDETGAEDYQCIRERENQLNWLTETVPGLLWCADSRGRIEYVNRRAEEYTGRWRHELRKNGWFDLLHPEDETATRRAWRRSLKTGAAYDSVHRFRALDGTYRWFQCKATAMRNANGKIVKWYGLSLDIDEPKRAEDRLRKTQVKLARATKIATVAELSASIAHELNQPLTSVVANAQACRRWLAASPPNLAEAKTSLDSLIRDARSADQTMQSIRALFKRQTFQQRERNVKDMVLEAVRLLREDENKRNVDISLDFPDGLPTVFVDQIQIQQVLINLIVNGIEATENTGRLPKILITACPQDERSVLLEVVDNGSGIPEAESIFDAFVTTKAKGMGIGLAVSRSIVEAHEGRLSASNNPSFGATFSVVLPVTPLASSQQAVGA
jgi:PAS domain S-box-containing protein